MYLIIAINSYPRYSPRCRSLHYRISKILNFKKKNSYPIFPLLISAFSFSRFSHRRKDLRENLNCVCSFFRNFPLIFLVIPSVHTIKSFKAINSARLASFNFVFKIHGRLIIREPSSWTLSSAIEFAFLFLFLPSEM